MRCIIGIVALALLATAVWAGVEIVDMPEALPEGYDLTWQMTADRAPIAPLQVGVETQDGKGHLLQVAGSKVTWQPSGGTARSAQVNLPIGRPCTMTLKRRAGMVAVLLDHRCVLVAPAPRMTGTLVFRQVPAGLTVAEARFREIAPILLSDDFMRSTEERVQLASAGWMEDLTWKSARYAGKDDPRKAGITDAAGAPETNPWKLSYYPSPLNTTNGFWWLYRGVGPSWCVATDTVSLTTWDRYAVQASVRTEADGEVGLVAAYQDNRNYLLFRWKQRGFPLDAPRAELVAVMDGEEKVLAKSTRGFDPQQWYEIRLNVGWREAQALVDGVELLHAHNPGTVEGRVGLYASGAERPHRAPEDTVTTSMYVPLDVKGNPMPEDPAKAARSLIYFDDVRVRDWDDTAPLAEGGPYAMQSTGKWQAGAGTLTAEAAGRYLAGTPEQSRYTLTTTVQSVAGVSAGLFLHMDAAGSGYAWTVNDAGQQLVPLDKGKWGAPVATSTVALKPSERAVLRAEVDGPYVALFCNGRRVMDIFDPARAAGLAGLFAGGAGVVFSGAQFLPLPADPLHVVRVHEFFRSDRYMRAWSVPESEWYPADYAGKFPAGYADLGPCLPLPGNVPGLFWHKGAHYRDLRLYLPLTLDQVDGQTLHLTSNYQPTAGYRLVLERHGDAARLRLLRKDVKVGAYAFTPTANYRLCLERRGSYLLCWGEEIDPEIKEYVRVVTRTLLCSYRDPVPLNAPMVGLTLARSAKVPDPAPAGMALSVLDLKTITVETDGRQETFDEAPDDWLVGGGVWQVTQRWSCQPQWNFFGGYGASTPTVWYKDRLDGDQVVEVYTGVKMRLDNDAEEYSRRYRDLCVTICADGERLNTGYTLMRCAKPDPAGAAVTQLMRKDVVVWRSQETPHLLPPQGQGHRPWFGIRLEKRGGEIQVYLDNRLATTYVDPDPLPGGYLAYWTLNNGMMVARSNVFAERITPGLPRAAAPLAVQEDFPARPTPVVSVGGTPLSLATFESTLDGWGPRMEWRKFVYTQPNNTKVIEEKHVPTILTGQVSRVRTDVPGRGSNTVAQVVNGFPAGDLSISLAKDIDLAATPVFTLDYKLGTGTLLNLYLSIDTPNPTVGEEKRPIRHWFEVQLTGNAATELNMVALGRVPAVADGAWHHLALDLGRLLGDGIRKAIGADPANLKVSEIIVADWSAARELRNYGFGKHPGGTTMAFDNAAWLPRFAGATTFTWAAPAADARVWAWRADIDDNFQGTPTTPRGNATLDATPVAATRYLHIQGKPEGGEWSPVVTVPVG